jgi:hypothetical protein
MVPGVEVNVSCAEAELIKLERRRENPVEVLPFSYSFGIILLRDE